MFWRLLVDLKCLRLHVYLLLRHNFNRLSYWRRSHRLRIHRRSRLNRHQFFHFRFLSLLLPSFPILLLKLRSSQRRPRRTRRITRPLTHLLLQRRLLLHLQLNLQLIELLNSLCVNIRIEIGRITAISLRTCIGSAGHSLA